MAKKRKRGLYKAKSGLGVLKLGLGKVLCVNTLRSFTAETMNKINNESFKNFNSNDRQ